MEKLPNGWSHFKAPSLWNKNAACNDWQWRPKQLQKQRQPCRPWHQKKGHYWHDSNAATQHIVIHLACPVRRSAAFPQFHCKKTVCNTFVAPCDHLKPINSWFPSHHYRAERCIASILALPALPITKALALREPKTNEALLLRARSTELLFMPDNRSYPSGTRLTRPRRPRQSYHNAGLANRWSASSIAVWKSAGLLSQATTVRHSVETSNFICLSVPCYQFILS